MKLTVYSQQKTTCRLYNSITSAGAALVADETALALNSPIVT